MTRNLQQRLDRLERAARSNETIPLYDPERWQRSMICLSEALGDILGQPVEVEKVCQALEGA